MSVTEPERLALHAAARGALGPEEGDTLVASLPPANTDIATRQDVERVEPGLRRDIDRVETGLRRELENHTAAIRKDLEHHAATSRKDLESAVERMRTHAWKVAFGSGVVLAIAITTLVVGATG